MASVLIERIMGLVEPRIPEHQFQAIACEWGRGSITGTQANAAIVACSRANNTAQAALDAELKPDDITEAQALLATIPTGSTAENKADRALRQLVIDQVLMLAAKRTAPYDTAAAVRARLGL